MRTIEDGEGTGTKIERNWEKKVKCSEVTVCTCVSASHRARSTKRVNREDFRSRARVHVLRGTSKKTRLEQRFFESCDPYEDKALFS